MTAKLAGDSRNLPVYSVVGDRYEFLVTGAETNGAYAVFDALVPPGGGTPPHIHRREDEAFHVIEGEFEFTVDGESVRVVSGGSLFARRDIPHNFKNVGADPGRLLIIVTPAGLENYFAEVGVRLPSRDFNPVPPSQEDIAKLISIAPHYGLELLLDH